MGVDFNSLRSLSALLDSFHQAKLAVDEILSDEDTIQELNDKKVDLEADVKALNEKITERQKTLADLG